MMNIFIVTSCIKTLITEMTVEDRYNQTLNSFDTIKKYADGATIIFCDSSIGGLDDSQKEVIQSKVDYFLDYSNDPTAQQLNQRRAKSMGETWLLYNSVLYAKNNLDLNQEGRMFKFGGRGELTEDFTMKDYENTEGKYVFKRKLVSWMDKNIQEQFGSTHILETRLFSWSLSLVDDYLSVLRKNFDLMNRGFDTEHAHYLNIPKDKLLEFDNMNYRGFVAGMNKYMHD